MMKEARPPLSPLRGTSPGLLSKTPPSLGVFGCFLTIIYRRIRNQESCGGIICTLQELLGHNDVSTTMIYCRQKNESRMAGGLPLVGSHVMNRPGVVTRSPLDGLVA